jgi:hypothetical protein
MEKWGEQAAYPLPLPAADYRVRYCARGVQHGSDLDTSQDPDRSADSYSQTCGSGPGLCACAETYSCKPICRGRWKLAIRL